MKDLLEEKIDTNPVCIGAFYRARISIYRTKRGFEKKISMVKLKRISCKGCIKCGWMEDDDAPVWGLDQVDHNEIYELTGVETSHCPVTGVCDDYALVFKERTD